MSNFEAEVEYYTRNPKQFLAAKRHLTDLHGRDGVCMIEAMIPLRVGHHKINDDYLLSERRAYIKTVRTLTELQPLHTLEGFERRGFFDMHVDHITSILEAFKLGWPPERCADISNLQMLPYKENMKKGSSPNPKLSL